jgi:hypothetical protein
MLCYHDHEKPENALLIVSTREDFRKSAIEYRLRIGLFVAVKKEEGPAVSLMVSFFT